MNIYLLIPMYASRWPSSKELLTVFGAVPPAGDDAAMAVSDGVGGGRQAHGLDQRAEGGGPGLLQLQQGDVVVKRVLVVILVHHDALDLRHVFRAPLRQHAEVGAPVTWVRKPGGVRGQGSPGGEGT